MPQHKSAKKRMGTNLKRQIRNRQVKSAMRSALRRYREMSVEDRKNAIADLYSVLDRAARKGVIHPKKAGRLKSRLSP
jgi:small subunit ribosomal protein S20